MVTGAGSPMVAAVLRVVAKMVADAPKPMVRAVVAAVNENGTVDLYWGGTSAASTDPEVVVAVPCSRLYSDRAVGDRVVVDLLDGGDLVVAYPLA